MTEEGINKDNETIANLRVLELFSGIGGMHYALEFAKLPATVVAAIDINTVANEVYRHHHKDTQVWNKNIQSLTRKLFKELDVNMLVMSPPCQPHTRQGLRRDLADNRSDALRHICSILPDCTTLKYILMENVRGFEHSLAREQYIQALKDGGFYWREFILTPTQFGVPNSRTRYYCLARKGKDFHIEEDDKYDGTPCESVPKSMKSGIIQQSSIASILETEIPMPLEQYQIPCDVLKKRLWLLDVVYSSSTNTMCFTKGYTHYSEGTGSVYTPLSKTEADDIFCQIELIENLTLRATDKNDQDPNKDEDKKGSNQHLKSLKLRYFTPREVARLMSFPEEFDFPSSITNRQKYKLLGNSINVRVVGELMKYLIDI